MLQAFIQFPKNGLLLIRGRNPVTGDSSGTGKSTVMLAVAYALDMCPFPATELQSWYTDEPMQVTLVLETDRGDVTISRGKSNRLTADWLPKPLTGAKAIREEVQRIFGLDTDTLRAITYRAQKKGGLFLGLTDSEKKEFLTRLLGLLKIETEVDIASEKARLAKPALDNSEMEVEQLKKQLEDLLKQEVPSLSDESKAEKESADATAEMILIQKKTGEILANARNLEVGENEDEEVIRLRGQLDAAHTHYQKAAEANTQAFEAFKAKQEGLRKQLADLAAKENMKLNLGRELERLRREQTSALQGNCPSCQRPWDESIRRAKELEAQIANQEAQLKNLHGSTVNRARVEEELRETFVQNPLLVRLKTVGDQLKAAINSRIVDLRRVPQEEAAAMVGQLNIQRAGLAAKIQGLDQQLRLIRETNRKIDAIRKNLEANTEHVRKRLAAVRLEVDRLRTFFNAESDFAAMMGYQGFLGAIFGEALQDIEARVNDRLSRLANVSHVTLHFKSETVTAAGKMNRTITPVAYVNGHEAHLDAGLSGGMYTSVEGIVDLAVMAVAQERTGTLPGFLFLDESFEGQGNATKESALEILREYGDEKLVVVVDHSSEIKEIFTQFITVEQKADGTSVIADQKDEP